MLPRGAVALLVSLAVPACAAGDGDDPPESPARTQLGATVDGCGGGPTVENGGFETGTFQGWSRRGRPALVPKHHSGTRGLRLARVTASAGQHWVQQAVEVPPAADGASSLSLWMQPHCAAAPDYRRVEVREVAGPRLATLLKDCTSSGAWEQHTFDLAPWAGQEVVLRVSAYDDGVAETPSYLFVDDIQVLTEVAPPAVLITEPADGDNVGGGVTVTAAPRTSACTSLDRVEFYADGGLFATSTVSPATVEWPGSGNGGHTLMARVFDQSGGTAEHAIDITWPCGSLPAWTASTASAGPVAPVAPALGPNGADIDGYPQWAAFVGNGNRLAAHDAGSGAELGTQTTAAAIARPPLVVEVGTGAEAITYVFIASSDGHLYRQQMVGGVMVPAGARDLRRPGCASDALVATPALQKKSLSGPGYALPGDTLFVATHHGCGDSSQNQIIAFDAAAPMDAPPLWTFNQFGEYQLGPSAGGCAVDHALDRIYCGIDTDPSSLDDSVWAIDVNTGNPVWAVDAGPVVSRPLLNAASRRLFVATRAGTVYGLDPDGAVNGTGKIDWGVSVATTGAQVLADLWTEESGSAAGKLFVVDTAGVLNMVSDNLTSGSVSWSFALPSGQSFTGGPVGRNQGALHQLYLGSDQGQVIQIRSSGPILETVRTIGGDFNETATPLLLPNALVGTSQASGGGTVTRRFCVPFTGGAPF